MMLEGGMYPKWSIYCPFEDPGSKNHTWHSSWNQNPKNGQHMDPLGMVGTTLCVDANVRVFQGFSYGPLVWASNLAPNIYLLYTIFKTGGHRRDPTRIKGAHTKGP